MFLRQRATQAEYFDHPERSLDEMRAHYAVLGRLNLVTRFARPFQKWLPQLLGTAACREASLLDLGAGDGLLGRTLTAWAGKQGWKWQFTNLDHCPLTGQLDPGGRHVVASATELPFPDASFDVVVATSMTHHLDSDADVVAHFREANRVARRAVLFTDLHRNVGFLVGLWLGLLGHRGRFGPTPCCRSGAVGGCPNGNAWPRPPGSRRRGSGGNTAPACCCQSRSDRLASRPARKYQRHHRA
jgi:SAM-dependent methyltransferase